MDRLRQEFKKKIENLIIPENLAEEQEKKILADLYMYSWQITPEYLFRYRSCTEHQINAFENDQIILSRPTRFNDPHDSLLYINRIDINELISINEERRLATFNKLISDTNFRLDAEKEFGKDFIDLCIQNNVTNGVVDELSLEEIEFTNRWKNQRIDKIIDISKKNIRRTAHIACFSEIADSILMWAHYSSNHTGFVLEYDMKNMYSIDLGEPNLRGSHFIDKKLFPVIYSNTRFNATEYAKFQYFSDYQSMMGLKTRPPFFDKLFYFKSMLYKSNHWKYEKEWRIIKLSDFEEVTSDFDIVQHFPAKAIYLGCAINKEHKSILLEISKNKNLKVYEMKVEDDFEEYKLTSVRIL